MLLRNLSCIGASNIPIKVLTCLSTRCFSFAKTQSLGFHTRSHLNSSISRVLFQKSKSQIVESKQTSIPQLTFEEKVKQTGKDASYFGIVLLGIAVCGAMFYYVGLELFSTQSPNGMYNAAHKLCLKDERVINALGDPIKASLGGRGRIRQVSCFFNFLVSQGFGVEDPIREEYFSYIEFMEHGTKVMNLQFYLEGPNDKGKVFVEARQDSKGVYEMTRIILQLNHRPYSPIIVLDKK